MPALLHAVLMPEQTPLKRGTCTCPGRGASVLQLTRLTLITVAVEHHAFEFTPAGQVTPADT